MGAVSGKTPPWGTGCGRVFSITLWYVGFDSFSIETVLAWLPGHDANLQEGVGKGVDSGNDIDIYASVGGMMGW